MFFDNLYKLCKANGTSPNKVAKELGISSGSITSWKNGTTPKSDAVKLVANYFNVSADYLLDTDNIKVYDEHDNIVVIDDETRDIIDTLRTNPEMKILFSVSKKATKEDILKAVKIIEALKGDE